MSELVWSEDYSVGITFIDNEHKLLVSLVNDINRIIGTHKDFQVQMIGDILKKLAYCIHRHFESEENFLLFNHYPSIACKSFSGVEIGFMLNLSTNTCRTFGVINAGNDGPKWIFCIPNDNNVNNTATAFCSYQETI